MTRWKNRIGLALGTVLVLADVGGVAARVNSAEPNIADTDTFDWMAVGR